HDEAGVRVESFIGRGRNAGLALHVIDVRRDLDGHERVERVRDKRRREERGGNRSKPGSHQAMPGLPSTPTTFGRLGDTRAMVLRSRRYFVITSQMGSPVTPSATGAQPATL